MGKFSKSVVLGVLSTGILLSSVVVESPKSTVQASTNIEKSKVVSQKAYISSVNKKIKLYKKRIKENEVQYQIFYGMQKDLKPLHKEVFSKIPKEDIIKGEKYYTELTPYVSFEKSKYLYRVNNVGSINRNQSFADQNKKYPTKRVTDEFKIIEKELKKKKINRTKVDRHLNIARSMIHSAGSSIKMMNTATSRTTFYVKELNFMHSELFGGDAKRSNVVKKFTPAELHYIDYMYRARRTLASRYESAIKSITSMDELENYTKLNKYGEYLNGIINDDDVYSKLSVKQRYEVLHSLRHYEEARDELMKNGIYSEDDISKRKEEVLKRIDAYYDRNVKAYDVVVKTFGKTSGKIDFYIKSSTDMTSSMIMLDATRDNWDKAFSEQPIKEMSRELKQLGLDMEE
ncbi:hypothetical protein JFL43_04320 [Viridibacillus sp. YIM B01967]|uniref:SbsC C-terminal domain-containing protein n=1 Tax=Viridibacillus soli TaxID=2798301 RepID=A0ABS1H3U4_9BACL|nr:hypothetical protein [Viridibacillus soli]MBK3494093.1 hypothetical protein [Viridibacillus soli]